MDMAKKVDRLRTAANKRLKDGHVGLSIDRSGSGLRLRGKFPPKPDSGQFGWTQQRISLKPLGITATPDGVGEAEKLARLISGQLARNEFKWDKYLPQKEEKPLLVRDWVARFEDYYFSSRERNPKSQTTWRTDYRAAFKKLPSEEPLTEKLLLSTLLKSEPSTRTRQRLCIAYGALAKFAEIDHDFKAWKGSYGAKDLEPRDIPTDEEIERIRETIESPSWQWAYGMIAAYGLRPHEVFYLDMEDFPAVRVTEGKTGSRTIFPLSPQWAENWGLAAIKLPPCSGPDHSALGHRVATQFRRYDVPFPPYSLRHAWAVRAINYGLDISLAAKEMGHSLTVHCKHYQRWISNEVFEKAHREIEEAIALKERNGDSLTEVAS